MSTKSSYAKHGYALPLNRYFHKPNKHTYKKI